MVTQRAGFVHVLKQQRATWVLNDRAAAARHPSPGDVAVRERAVWTLGLVLIGTAITFFGAGALSEWLPIRPPVEVMAAPGLAASGVLVVCRSPARRDWSLSRLIVYSTAISFLASALGVIAWPGPILGTFWALTLACVLACWALYFHWRTR